MKRIFTFIIILTLLVFTACTNGKDKPLEDESKRNINLITGPGPAVMDPDDENLSSFAVSIAKNFTQNYGFEAVGEYSKAEGIVITITAEGSSEWLDHAWDEMNEAIGESYIDSMSTMNRAGTGETSLTYLVCDTDNIVYLRFVNGKVEL